MKRLAAYTRVSTREQADSGLGLEAQRAAIQRWAEYKTATNGGVELVWFEDAGKSGTNLRRPGLQEALGAIRAGKLDGIVVAKFDRLSRRVRDFSELLDELTTSGKVFTSVAEELDTSTAHGAFAARLFGNVAQLERDLISERTIAALDAKRARGERLGGRAPYGYIAREGALEPLPAEQATLARIRELRALGESLGGIAAILNADLQAYPPRGAKWHATTIQRICSR